MNRRTFIKVAGVAAVTAPYVLAKAAQTPSPTAITAPPNGYPLSTVGARNLRGDLAELSRLMDEDFAVTAEYARLLGRAQAEYIDRQIAHFIATTA